MKRTRCPAFPSKSTTQDDFGAALRDHQSGRLKGMARRLVEWCGLEWEPACLAFHQNRRPVRTASVTQVRQPIYKRSVARWRNY